MCGIAGIVTLGGERGVTRAAVERMVEKLIHRGPDEDGYVVLGGAGLGVRRLAVIDLKTGSQPVANEDESVWVVLNGEIYNFHALRAYLKAKGHVLKTQGDTEVIAHLYEDNPDRFISGLNGMFAFALWDARRRRLLIARDRLGVKPLYYAILADRIVFGSEIKALLVDRDLPRDLDLQAFHDYLSLGYVPGPRSIFGAVRKLGPGEVLRVEEGRVTVRPYWRYPRPEAGRTSTEPVTAIHRRLLDLLDDAVRVRLISDVPFGLFLSGGVDSSAVLAIMARQTRQPVKTFSIGFGEKSYSELPFARTVAASVRAEHSEEMIAPDLAVGVQQIADILDEPFADSSALPAYYLSRMARRSVTVALSGDGGDETFGGYYTYLGDRMLGAYRRVPVVVRDAAEQLARFIPLSERKLSLELRLRRFLHGARFDAPRAHYAWKEWLTEEDKAALYSPSRRDWKCEPTYTAFEDRFRAAGTTDPVNAGIYVDSTTYLPDDILVKADRMSMANSLELRSPFLDYRIIEAMARVPGTQKVRGLRLKALLKDALRGVVPDEILRRKKAGFNVPLAAWLRGPLRPLLLETLGHDRLAQRGLLDADAVHRLVAAHMARAVDYSRPLWNLLMFGLWEHRFGRTPS